MGTRVQIFYKIEGSLYAYQCILKYRSIYMYIYILLVKLSKIRKEVWIM